MVWLLDNETNLAAVQVPLYQSEIAPPEYDNILSLNSWLRANKYIGFVDVSFPSSNALSTSELSSLSLSNMDQVTSMARRLGGCQWVFRSLYVLCSSLVTGNNS
jgi:hypothetical protein